MMADAQSRTFCSSLFKQSEIQPIPFQYILSLMMFIFNDQDIFSKSSMHNINTRNKHHLHRPNAKLSCFQKSTFCAGINIFNSLPSTVAILKNDEAKLKKALRTHPHTLLLFYTWILCV